LWGALPTLSFAAHLYLDPADGTYVKGDTFSLKVRLDNDGECVNAVDVRLGFPAETLKAVDVGTGSSILTLWAEKPHIDKEKGTVTFSGGLPGGYCGRVEGDPGLTNVLAEVIFQTAGITVGKKPADAGSVTFLPGSAVLLADGFGTPAFLKTTGASFQLSAVGTTVKDGWLDAVKADNIQPQPFAIELSSSPSMYGGGYFVVFSTTDKESGIDHYEIQESDILREGLRVGSSEKAPWRRGDSPYHLEDQSLNSIVRVKAFDKAGNERIAAFVPDESIRHFRMTREYWWYVGAGVALLVVVIVILFLVYRRRKAKSIISSMSVDNPSDEHNLS
jgi:hypothetical protein